MSLDLSSVLWRQDGTAEEEFLLGFGSLTGLEFGKLMRECSALFCLCFTVSSSQGNFVVQILIHFF